MDDKPKTPTNDAMEKLKGTTVSLGTQVLELVAKVDSSSSDSNTGKLPGFDLSSFLKPYIGKKVKLVIEEVKEV